MTDNQVRAMGHLRNEIYRYYGFCSSEAKTVKGVYHEVIWLRDCSCEMRVEIEQSGIVRLTGFSPWNGTTEPIEGNIEDWKAPLHIARKRLDDSLLG